MMEPSMEAHGEGYLTASEVAAIRGRAWMYGEG